MSPEAIILMMVTILLVWGGLVASVILLRVLSVPSDEETRLMQAQIGQDSHDE